MTGTTNDKPDNYLMIFGRSENRIPKRILSRFIKRLTDIFLSFLALLFLWPVFLLISKMIKRDSPGPAIYHAIRIGKNGKPFKMVKFRTMFDLPASNNGPVITAKGDPRVTKVGKWLRETKLNELPQFWNVLKGDMSLVGPRPEVSEIVSGWPDDARQMVLSIRPGITSPASIIFRDEEKLLSTDNLMDDYLKKILPDKLRLDQLYIENSGFLKDLDILIVTLLALLPAIRNRKIKESTFFSGPIYRFFTHVVSWFLVDILVAMISIGISGLVFRMREPLDYGIPAFIGAAFGVSLIISILGTIFGLHKVTWRNASPIYLLDIGFIVIIAFLSVFVIFNYLVESIFLPPGLVWSCSLLTFIGLVTVRYRERLLTGLTDRWTVLRNAGSSIGEKAVIVGAGTCGELALWLIHRSKLGSAFSIIGFLDDDYHKKGVKIHGYPVLGNRDEIPSVVQKKNIGVIFFAICNCSEEEKSRIMKKCEESGAQIVIIPDLVKMLEQNLSESIIKESK